MPMNALNLWKQNFTDILLAAIMMKNKLQNIAIV
jgi:hypothetical protein